MKTFVLFIKSHCAYPDFEQEINAVSKKEAIHHFYVLLRGEFDKEFISKNIITL